MNKTVHLVLLANDRLKKGRVGVTLGIRSKGEWFYIRGTFSPKAGQYLHVRSNESSGRFLAL